MVMFFVCELFINQQRCEIIGKFIKFRFSIKSVLIDKANHIKLQNLKIWFYEG